MDISELIHEFVQLQRARAANDGSLDPARWALLREAIPLAQLAAPELHGSGPVRLRVQTGTQVLELQLEGPPDQILEMPLPVRSPPGTALVAVASIRPDAPVAAGWVRVEGPSDRGDAWQRLTLDRSLLAAWGRGGPAPAARTG